VSSGALVQLLASQAIGHAGSVMVTLLGLTVAGFLLAAGASSCPVSQITPEYWKLSSGSVR